MKALTIKQPWASLIIEGYKIYEFRSWKTNYRGKILIHAGLNYDYKNDKFAQYNLKYPKGMIIGEANLVDCILIDKELDSELRKANPDVYGHNHIGIYGWKLENVIKYKKPILVKGKLGLWNYEKTTSFYK